MVINLLVDQARGCFLYVKLILDLLERGSLTIKSSTFKVLPQTLSEVYQLAFNQRFNSAQAFEQVPYRVPIACLQMYCQSLSARITSVII